MEQKSDKNEDLRAERSGKAEIFRWGLLIEKTERKIIFVV